MSQPGSHVAATAESSAGAVVGAVIFGGLIMGVALGIRHVQGLFLVPMTTDRGWSREAFGFAMAIQNLTWGVAQPFAGMVADRFGAVRVLVTGTLLYLAGLIWMACATTPLGLALGGGVLIGIALSCTTFGVVYGALSRIASPAKRSWALGVAGAVGGLGQFIMVPLSLELQRWFGWSIALLVFGGLIAALTPTARRLNDRNTTRATAVGTELSMAASVKEAFAHRGFWLLNVGFLACGFQLAFIAAHLPAYLLDKGLSPTTGVAALAIIALTNIAGLYSAGLWGGLYRRKHLLAGLYLLRTACIALFLLAPLSTVSVYIFSGVIGFLWLGTVPMTNALVSGVFGVRYITTLFGFVFFGHQVGGFLGVWMGGRVFDITHSYNLIWAVSMCIGLVAAVLHLFIDDAPVVRTRQLQPAT